MDVLREKNSKATLWHSNPALRSIIEEFQILFSIIGILHPLDKIPLYRDMPDTPYVQAPYLGTYY